jgi:hypothetical protein
MSVACWRVSVGPGPKLECLKGGALLGVSQPYSADLGLAMLTDAGQAPHQFTREVVRLGSNECGGCTS